MQDKKPADFNANLDYSINQLENVPIPRPSEYESHLVKRCFDLANKKLKYFSPEDLRIMIGQNLGLDYLIPISIQILEKEPFLEADFYEGDLLLNVLKIDKDYWDRNPEIKRKLINIFKKSLVNFNELDSDTQKDLYEAYDSI